VKILPESECWLGNRFALTGVKYCNADNLLALISDNDIVLSKFAVGSLAGLLEVDI
jgi:hypothetical protein